MGQWMLGVHTFSNFDIEDLAFKKINIQNVNVITISCNIASGSFINGKSDHTIHSFFALVSPGYKLVEVPKEYYLLSYKCKYTGFCYRKFSRPK